VSKGGPATQEGREVVRWNTTRHGIRSPAPVIPGIEKAEDWEEHRDGVLESLSPVGHLEFVLAEQVALLSWRLHRVIRYETESIALYQESAEDDLARERRFESGPDHPEAVRGNAKSAKEALLERAGLPHTFRFHDLRHTFATLMASSGGHAKVVQEMLGHASINITLDLYSHVLPDMQEDAVYRLGAMLS
jgi:hypothetical protein